MLCICLWLLNEHAVLSAQAFPLLSTNSGTKDKPWLSREHPTQHCSSQVVPEMGTAFAAAVNPQSRDEAQ